MTLSDEQLREMLALTEQADTVELKLTIPDSAQRSTAAALEVDPLEGQIRQVFFFDTPDLALDSAGVVVRARRVQGRGDDSVVKLRPIVPGDLSDELRALKGFGVEVDAMPGGYVCSASMKGVPHNDVRETILGGGPVHKLFTKHQRALYEERAPDGVAMDDLAVLGPLFVLKLKFSPKELGRKLVAEMWLYPDGSRVVELSTKCPPSEAFQVAAETRAFLSERDVPLSGEQQTKTRKALDFFSGELAA